MNKIYHLLLGISLTMALFLISSSAGWCGVSVQSVCPVDVTPSGFAVIGQTSGYASPGIRIFSDAAGTKDITKQLEIIPYPLSGGNPQIAGEYQRDEDMENLRNKARTLGLMKIRVERCLPETDYYYQFQAKVLAGETIQWPAEPPFPSVTTTRENSFIADSKQIVASLSDPAGELDFTGYMITASTSEALFGVSSFVGDGAGHNQAYINLSNLFGSDGFNWTPTGSKEITLEVKGMESGSVYKIVLLDYTNNFSPSTAYAVGINMSSCSKLPAVTLNSPAHGATNVSLTPAISWSAVSEASFYHLILIKGSGDGTGAVIIDESNLTTPYFNVPFGKLTESTSYAWKVVAVNSCGQGEETDPFVFATGGSTLVGLEPLKATLQSSKILITWRTLSEIDTAGFNLWRSESEGGKYIKVNPKIIAATGGATLGAEYSYFDDTAIPGVKYYYKLEDISTNGGCTFYGPVPVLLM